MVGNAGLRESVFRIGRIYDNDSWEIPWRSTDSLDSVDSR